MSPIPLGAEPVLFTIAELGAEGRQHPRAKELQARLPIEEDQMNAITAGQPQPHEFFHDLLGRAENLKGAEEDEILTYALGLAMRLGHRGAFGIRPHTTLMPNPPFVT